MSTLPGIRDYPEEAALEPSTARHSLVVHTEKTAENMDGYCLEKFNEALQYETISAAMPKTLAAADIPQCECGSACILRQHLDPAYQGMCMWVCSLGTCMIWQPATESETPGTKGAPSGFGAASSSTGGLHSVPQDFNVERVDACVESNDVSGFWADVGKIAHDLDDETARVLTVNFDVPNCACGVPVGCMLCTVTGAMFFSCKDKTCVYLQKSDQCAEIGDMDIGQWCKLGESMVDRYTTLQYAMRWLGYTFSKKYWRTFLDRLPTCDYEKGSYQMPPGKEYSGFLSYRGGSGRFAIQSAFCIQFNLMPGFYFLFIVCPIIAICLTFVKDTCAEGYNASRAWLVWSNGCQDPTKYRSWFIFRSFGPAVVVLIVVFWHPTFSWFYRHHKLFIDKLKNSCFLVSTESP